MNPMLNFDSVKQIRLKPAHIQLWFSCGLDGNPSHLQIGAFCRLGSLAISNVDFLQIMPFHHGYKRTEFDVVTKHFERSLHTLS